MPGLLRARILFFVGWFCFSAIAWAAEEDGPRVSITPRATTSGAGSQRKVGSDTNIRVDVKLTTIPVNVTDALGAPYPGLGIEDFRLFEDGAEQELKFFSSNDAPLSLGVVFDASQSMSGKLTQSRAAVSRFFTTVTGGDEFFLIAFNDVPRLLCDFTGDTERIEKTLFGIQPKNWTALFDAVYLSVRKMTRARNPRRALLILSDGGDNYSRYSQSEIKSLVRESDVTIYSIALVGGGLGRRHVSVLRGLSEPTGGRVYEVERMADLPQAVANASAAIRNQYLLGYMSKNHDNNGLYRKVEVRLNPRPDSTRLRVSWRTGYYGPGE